MLITDKGRNIVERSEYEPYGSLLNHSVIDGPGYTGHVMDASTGLTYMQQRYYDPMIGRLLSTDPVMASQKNGENFNRYKYASNNPYRFIDPDGRYECRAGNNCEALKKAVTLINKASETAPYNSRVAQVSRLFGKPGEKNGVIVSDKLVNSKNLGEAVRTSEGINIALNFKALSSTDKLGSAAAHEGSHGVDERDDVKAEQILVTKSRSALNATEVNAGFTQAQMFQYLGRSEPFNLYSLKGGINWDAINSQADRSVKQTCQTRSDCNP
ncbi:RHS repeat-associated core domain-containing protein [uncultured Xanthomonas sp.]|uniref:RHS repeat-associated core domain-containing protein n=1 Tax=uncultured Xanthomonas sp. TaxID=152831 RepID=UPI0025CE8F9D|nr:RHS repeat-associated core domain-containing protein [uncultured Xanthomonas sp.]